MLNDRENILSALHEKPLKVHEVMKRANVVNEEACQSLLLKMRDEGLVKFESTKGDGSSDDSRMARTTSRLGLDKWPTRGSGNQRCAPPLRLRAHLGHGVMSNLSPSCAHKQTCIRADRRDHIQSETPQRSGDHHRVVKAPRF